MSESKQKTACPHCQKEAWKKVYQHVNKYCPHKDWKETGKYPGASANKKESMMKDEKPKTFNSLLSAVTEAKPGSVRDIGDEHQLKIAKMSMKDNCFGARLGGMSHYDAARVIKQHTGKTVRCSNCMKDYRESAVEDSIQAYAKTKNANTFDKALALFKEPKPKKEKKKNESALTNNPYGVSGGNSLHSTLRKHLGNAGFISNVHKDGSATVEVHNSNVDATKRALKHHGYGTIEVKAGSGHTGHKSYVSGRVSESKTFNKLLNEIDQVTYSSDVLKHTISATSGATDNETIVRVTPDSQEQNRSILRSLVKDPVFLDA